MDSPLHVSIQAPTLSTLAQQGLSPSLDFWESKFINAIYSHGISNILSLQNPTWAQTLWIGPRSHAGNLEVLECIERRGSQLWRPFVEFHRRGLPAQERERARDLALHWLHCWISAQSLRALLRSRSESVEIPSFERCCGGEQSTRCSFLESWCSYSVGVDCVFGVSYPI